MSTAFPVEVKHFLSENDVSSEIRYYNLTYFFFVSLEKAKLTKYAQISDSLQVSLSHVFKPILIRI